jgi:hypothetical protein
MVKMIFVDSLESSFEQYHKQRQILAAYQGILSFTGG